MNLSANFENFYSIKIGNGDSGGPMVCGGCLTGATSWAMKPCAQQKYPVVYANVANLNAFYSAN